MTSHSLKTYLCGRLALVLVSLPIGITACGTTNQGTITGTLKSVGGPPPGSRGIPGIVTLASTSGRKVTVKTNANGDFSVAVASGTYRVSAASPKLKIAAQACPPDRRVIVQAHQTTTVAIDCAVH